MFANNLTCIDLVLRLDEEATSVLKMVDCISISITALKRNKGAIDAAIDVALIGLVFLETMCNDSFALTCCEHVRPEAYDAATRDEELDVDAFALTLHACHLALPSCYHINHLRRELLRHIDGHLLNRFAFHAIYLFVDDLGLTDLQFIAFATHRLDEHREMKHATTRDNPTVGITLGNLNAKSQVLLEFALQAFTYVTARAILSFLSKEG